MIFLFQMHRVQCEQSKTGRFVCVLESFFLHDTFLLARGLGKSTARSLQ